MQIESKKFKTYIGNEKGDASFRSNSVICTLGDSRGFYWIGTREGLAVYDPKTDCLALIGAEQGLADESVFAITEDTQKNVWITTSGGISKITVQNASQGKFPASFSVTNYNQQDGLQNASFNQNSILTTSNGVVYFGGMSGLNSVEANAKKTAAVKENLLFTRIFVDGDEVEIGKYYGGVEVLPSAFYTLDKVSLPNNASIEICVTSDCFARSEKLQYVYKLDGIDNAWVSAGEHNIVYRNLPAGKYLLHLKGLNSQGEEKTLTIVVEPIFWLTTRAFILYAVVIALIILWLMWMRPRYKARRSRFKAMEEQLANLKNLAEEFRAPVSTMIPPLNSLVESEEDSTKREYLTTIHYQATQILNLTNKLQGLFEADQVEESISDMRVKAKRFAAEEVSQQTSAVEQAVEDVHYQV
ncbi:MAG: hypothetical protein HUJ98_12130, partial [Bacteroidaceae bacterium]|nr:hypothetical protein [Bacteroidaceae bacterium]